MQYVKSTRQFLLGDIQLTCKLWSPIGLIVHRVYRILFQHKRCVVGLHRLTAKLVHETDYVADVVTCFFRILGNYKRILFAHIRQVSLSSF